MYPLFFSFLQIHLSSCFLVIPKMSYHAPNQALVLVSGLPMDVPDTHKPSQDSSKGIDLTPDPLSRLIIVHEPFVRP